MTRILFVDDEPMVLRSLDRAFRAQRRPWQVAFAGSGEDALALLDREPFDVVVSDIGMPAMDGITLLQNVRDRYPHIARLALSGEATTTNRQRAVSVIHQWLAKPCPLAKLCGTIEHVTWARALIDDPAIITAACQLASLPSAPAIYLKVTAAVARDAGLAEIVRLIETDPAIAAKLLQLVNSAFFGQAERVNSVMRAAALIGMDLLRDLLLAAEVFRDGNTTEEAAAHAQLVAHLARAFAPAAVADDAFVAGLLHDLGTLAVPQASPSPTLHARIAGLLLGTWGLPVEVVMAVTFHHDPDSAPNPLEPTMRALALAEALAGELERTSPAPVPEVDVVDVVDVLAASLKLEPVDVRRRARAVRDSRCPPPRHG